MNRFQENADRGLSYFTDFCHKHNREIFSDYPKNHPFDCAVTGKQESIVEIKCRTEPIGTYPDCYLELGKYERLMQCSREEGKPVYYVALYPESDKICIWRLEDKCYPWEIRYMNDKTSVDNPRKIPKKVILLPISDAQQVDFSMKSLSV